MDLHKLLKEGAARVRACTRGKPELHDADPATLIEAIKREHLDWGHLRRADATPDDLRAMRLDLIEAAARLLEVAGGIDLVEGRAA